MTEKKDLKARVRERMDKTGERYTAALAHVLAAPLDSPPSSSPITDVVEGDALENLERCPTCALECAPWFPRLDEEKRRGVGSVPFPLINSIAPGVLNFWCDSCGTRWTNMDDDI